MNPKIDLIDINTSPIGALTPSLPLIVWIVACSIDGITGGNVSVANASIAYISDDKIKGKNYGKMAISFKFGFIVGPALVSILERASYGNTLPVITAIFFHLFHSLNSGDY